HHRRSLPLGRSQCRQSAEGAAPRGRMGAGAPRHGGAPRGALVPGHGMPVFGAARVRQALEDTAEWLETLEHETVARMNAGLTLDRILAEVRPPAHLAERPYLQAVYDEPEYVVRNVLRLHGRSWDR